MLIACRGFWLALTLVVVVTVPQLAWARPPVERQMFDQSCGLATVATALRWAGLDYSEAQLFERLREQLPSDQAAQIASGRRGLSVVELRRLVEELGEGVTLHPRHLTAEELRRAAGREVLILFSLEPSMDGTAKGHFSLLDGYSSGRGYLRADTLDGSYAFQKEGDLLTSASIWKSQTKVLVLYIRRAGRPLVVVHGLDERAEQALPDFSSARLLRALAPLKPHETQLTAVAFRASSKVNYAKQGLPFSIKSEQQGLTFGVRRGLANGLDLTLDVALSSEDGYIKFQGGEDEVYLGTDRTLGPVSIGLSRMWSPAGKPSLSLGGRVDVTVARVDRAEGAGISGRLLWAPARGDYAIITEGGWRADRTVDVASDAWTKTRYVSLGIVRRLPDQYWLSVNGRWTEALGRGERVVGLSVGLEKALTSQTTVGGFVDIFAANEGYPSAAFGVTVTYTLRRSAF